MLNKLEMGQPYPKGSYMTDTDIFTPDQWSEAAWLAADYTKNIGGLRWKISNKIGSVVASAVALFGVGYSALNADTAYAQDGPSIVRIVRTLGEPWNQCGQTEGLEEWPANVDVFVQPVKAIMSDGGTQDTTTESFFSVDEYCPIKQGSAPVEQPASFEIF